MTSNIGNANEYERLGLWSEAFYLLVSESRKKVNFPMSYLVDMNLFRLVNKIKYLARNFMLHTQVIPLYEGNKTPYTYSQDSSVSGNALPPIVSFTTIGSRIGSIEQTIESIKKQSIQYHSVNLYISSKPYLLDSGIDPRHKKLKNIAEMGVNIYHVPNIGPYRKQLPLIIQLRESKAPLRTPIITIDDDTLYPDSLINALISSLEANEAVIAHRGREMILEDKNFAPYKNFRPPKLGLSLLNIGTGKNGIAYRLGFFPNDLSAYAGHFLAPTADDIWCKLITYKGSIPTLVLEPNAAYIPDLDFPEIKSNENSKSLYDSFNKQGLNDIALNNINTYLSFINNMSYHKEKIS